jgi:regulator of RNase E activity RraA
MNIGCRIIKDFERPPKELVRRFYDLAVSDLDDTMSKFGAVDHRIQPMRKYNRSMVGTAFTIRLPHGDNLMFRAAIQYIKRGDVVVIDAGGFEDRAVAGEVTAKYCRARGAKGLIIDGATRDSAVLSEMENFPVFVRAISPNGPYFNGPGEVNVPIVVGGQIVCPGDIVVADSDGIVFINPANAEEVLAQSVKITTRDRKNLKELEETGTCNQDWVEDKLKAIGCEMVDMAKPFRSDN